MHLLMADSWRDEKGVEKMYLKKHFVLGEKNIAINSPPHPTPKKTFTKEPFTKDGKGQGQCTPLTSLTGLLI